MDAIQYRVVGLIGKGGFGRVYRARLETEGFVKEVAIKVLRDRAATSVGLERLREEARMLGLVRDRAIIAVEPPVRLNGQWAIVMELVDGCTLSQLIHHVGPIPTSAALEIVAEIARALDKVFNHPGPDGAPLGLVHRDIKPANVQVTQHGELKLLDFGLARQVLDAGGGAEPAGDLVGTRVYMAPELFVGGGGGDGAGPAADIYALGRVLEEMLTGRVRERNEPRIEPADAEDAATRAALQLVNEMTRLEPDARPTARDVEHRCEVLLEASGRTTSLRMWAERAVPQVPPRMAEDTLTGEILSPSKSEASKIAASTPRSNRPLRPPDAVDWDEPATVRMAGDAAAADAAAADAAEPILDEMPAPAPAPAPPPEPAPAPEPDPEPPAQPRASAAEPEPEPEPEPTPAEPKAYATPAPIDERVRAAEREAAERALDEQAAEAEAEAARAAARRPAPEPDVDPDAADTPSRPRVPLALIGAAVAVVAFVALGVGAVGLAIVISVGLVTKSVADAERVEAKADKRELDVQVTGPATRRVPDLGMDPSDLDAPTGPTNQPPPADVILGRGRAAVIEPVERPSAFRVTSGLEVIPAPPYLVIGAMATGPATLTVEFGPGREQEWRFDVSPSASIEASGGPGLVATPERLLLPTGIGAVCGFPRTPKTMILMDDSRAMAEPMGDTAFYLQGNEDGIVDVVFDLDGPPPRVITIESTTDGPTSVPEGCVAAGDEIVQLEPGGEARVDVGHEIAQIVVGDPDLLAADRVEGSPTQLRLRALRSGATTAATSDVKGAKSAVWHVVIRPL